MDSEKPIEIGDYFRHKLSQELVIVVALDQERREVTVESGIAKRAVYGLDTLLAACKPESLDHLRKHGFDG